MLYNKGKCYLGAHSIKISKKTDKVGGRSSIPTSTNHNTTQKVKFFVKTKSVSQVLKCKINNKFCHKYGVPKLGEKFPHFPVFVLGERPLIFLSF